MGVRHPTVFSRGRRQRRTRLGSRSTRRRKDLGRNKILKSERKEVDIAIQQAKRNKNFLNSHLKKKVGLLPTPPEKLSVMREKTKKTIPVLDILAWIGKLFLRK